MDTPDWNLAALNQKLSLVADKEINDSTFLKQSQAVAELTRWVEKASGYLNIMKDKLEEEKARVMSYNQRKQREMEESMALLAGKIVESKSDTLEPLETKTEKEVKKTAWATVAKKEKVEALPVTVSQNGHVGPTAVDYEFKDTNLRIRVFIISNPNEAAHPSRRGYLCWMESQNRFWFWLSGQLIQCQPPHYVQQGHKYKMLDFDVSYGNSDHGDSNFYRNPLDFPDSKDVRGYYPNVQIIPASRAGARITQYAMPVGDLATAAEDLTRASSSSLRRQADWGTSQLLISLLINQELNQRYRVAKNA